jgi:O-antigen ligase
MCAITFSAARSVLLAAGTSLIAGLLLVAFYNQKFRKRITWTVIAMLATGAVMTFFFDSEMSRRLSQYIESPNAKNAAQSDFPIDGARPLWWRVGIDNYLQNPIVGSGMGSAEPLIHGDKEVDDVTSAGSRNQFVLRDDFHSSYITALSETGSIGGLLFAGWILLVFAKTFSRAEASPILLATLVAYLIFAIFNTTFYSGRLVAITAYLTVLALSVCPQLESKNE